MSINSVFEGVDTFVIITIFLFMATLFFGFLLAVFIHILHLMLSRRLDPILFNYQWFSIGEVAMMSLWPFSLFKSSYYAFLITFPNFARRKRFKGLQNNLPIETPLRIASKIYMYFYILTAMVGVALLVFVVIYLIFYFKEPP